MRSNDGGLERLRDAIKARITLAEVCAKDGLEGERKEGRAVRARCPFHAEKSGSFLIGGRDPHRAHCFGCGWSGDVFDYWAQRHGVATHVETVNQLASLVGLAPVMESVKWERPKAKALVVARGNARIEAGQKPRLPRLRELREEEIGQLAALRGLNVAAVRLAARVFKRVGGCEWPLYLNRRENRWMSPCVRHWMSCDLAGPECAALPRFPSWVVTDGERWVAQFRRLDGELYEQRGRRGEGRRVKGEGSGGQAGSLGHAEADAEPHRFKSWTVGSATWPIGCGEIGHRTNVILVEGGADMLAAYHFLFHFGQRALNGVAVCCMLGVGRIAAQALPFFKGKKVRIICDNDEEQVKVTKDREGNEVLKKSKPGADAAARWTEQLTAAGACVKTFYLGDVCDAGGELVVPGMVTREGKRVKDLNEAAMGCGLEVIEEELRTAFCEWKEGFGG